MEKKLIKVLGNRDNYDKYVQFLDKKLLTKETEYLVSALSRFYKDHASVMDVDWDEFFEWATVCNPPSSDVGDLLKLVLPTLSTLTVTESDPVIKRLLERYYAKSIAEHSLDVASGQKGKELVTVAKLYEEYEHRSGLIGGEAVGSPDSIINTLAATGTSSPGYNWRLHDLNVCIGPVSKGDLIVVGARPETGKTTFAFSEITYWAQQFADPGTVLVFNNEEKDEAVRERAVQAVLGRSRSSIIADPIKAQKDYLATLGDNKIGIYSDPGMNTRTVERICRSVRPKAIVFNVMDKVFGLDEGKSDVERLRRLFQWARTLAAQYGPVMAIVQADASADGEKYIEMHQVYGSKCLAKGTRVLMFDGTEKCVEDVAVGEQVMGPDSTPRNVLATSNGTEAMYEVRHKDGQSYTVNESHILSLRKSSKKNCYAKQGEIVDVPLTEFIAKPDMRKHLHGFSVPVQYPKAPVPIDPWLLGYWLADGHSKRAEWASKDRELCDAIAKYAEQYGFQYGERTDGNCYYSRFVYKQGIRHPFLNELKALNVYGNKHIPRQYLVNDMETRLALLSGLIDGDGTLAHNRGYEYVSVAQKSNTQLTLDVVKLAKSCGYRARAGRGKIDIYGDLSKLSCVLPRKQSKVLPSRHWLGSPLTIVPQGVGEYYGFTVDGDHRYVLADSYIVTHNTAIQGEADAVIMIGKTYDPKEEMVRFFNIPKNKLPGGPLSDPSRRHGKFVTSIKPEIARYEPLTIT